LAKMVWSEVPVKLREDVGETGKLGEFWFVLGHWTHHETSIAYWGSLLWEQLKTRTAPQETLWL
jgi:hypothetical protein